MKDSFTDYSFPNFGWTRLPKPPISKNNRNLLGLDENCNNSLFLKTLCMKGFKEKLERGEISKNEHQKYLDRCELELKTFEELHFVDYILLVWATVEKARGLGIFMDWGRGSVSSSAVCWFLKISGCDPIKYGLFFSRFISKVRAESKMVDGEIWIKISLAPDVDLNLGEGRDKIVEWLKEIYPNRVCKISNLTCLTGKMCVKDVYKTMREASESDAQSISNLVERQFGVVQDLEDVYHESVEFKKWADNFQDVYKTCLSLENLVRQRGVHASGYALSFEELDERTPLVLDKDKNIVSAFVMDDCQSLKLDLLNLDTNRIIKEILESTNSTIDGVNLENDPLIYDRLQSGDFLPYGLYQISAPCAYGVCKELKPKNVLELSHVNAIARPAALAYKKPYLDPKSKCPHELFRESLKPTNFQPLYQEQTISMVKSIGFSEEEAEQFRRVFAKKKIDEIEQWVQKTKEKIKENNISQDAGDILVKLAEESANYQFNLSHSVSTSYLTACTVYLKYKYPIEFFVACLNDVNNKPNPKECLAEIQQELVYFGIKLLPPNLLCSSAGFKEENGNIRYGLSSIKGVSVKNIDKLLTFRRSFSNKFEIFKAAADCGLPINIVSTIILAGGLDGDGVESPLFRNRQMLSSQIFNLLTDREQTLVLKFGEKFNYDLFAILKHFNTAKNEENKPYIKPSRIETLRKHAAPYFEIFRQNEKNEEHRNFCVWFFEKELLGYSYSISLQDVFKKKAGDIYTLQTIQGELDGAHVKVVGEVTEFIECKSRNDNKQWKFYISDQTSKMKVYFTNNKKSDKIQEYLESGARKPGENDIVIIKGTKKENVIFADSIALQDLSVIRRISEIEKASSIDAN